MYITKRFLKLPYIRIIYQSTPDNPSPLKKIELGYIKPDLLYNFYTLDWKANILTLIKTCLLKFLSHILSEKNLQNIFKKQSFQVWKLLTVVFFHICFNYLHVTRLLFENSSSFVWYLLINNWNSFKCEKWAMDQFSSMFNLPWFQLFRFLFGSYIPC